MAEEPSGQDIRRLRTLENRLEKETEDRKTIQAERNRLRREIRSANRQLEKLEAQASEKDEAAKQAETELKELRQANKQLQRDLAACEKLLGQETKRLEAELKKTREEAKASIDAANDQLAACRAELEEAKALIEQLQGSEGTVPQLLEENQRLAALAEANSGDLESFRTVADEATAALKTVQDELQTVSDDRAQIQENFQQVSAERTSLQNQVTLLTEQVQTEGKTPLLPADQVAVLIGGLVDELQTGLPGMSIRDSEIRLKVGFGAVGDKTGFVVPTPDSDADVRENLHEVVVRFDRTPTLASSQLLRQIDQS